MKKRNSFEAKLSAIRVEFYEKTKDMSSSERIAYLNEQIAPVLQEHGIKMVSRTMTVNEREIAM